MAGLISCPDCGHSVSSRAPSCPNCGGPIAGESQTVYVDQPAGFGTGFNVGCGVVAAIVFCLFAIPVGCTMCMGAAATSALNDIDTAPPEDEDDKPWEVGK